MFETLAWYQSVDQAGAYNAMTAVADQSHTLSGTTGYVVGSLNNLILAAAGAEKASQPYARLTSPSLRVRSLFRIAPLNTGTAAAVKPLDPPNVVDLSTNPIALVTGEALTCEILADPAAAQIQWGVAWLGDGKVAPVAGNMFTVMGTATATLTAGSWTNSGLTFAENLPRGRYQIVGMHAVAAGLIAARLVLVGQGNRPGVLGGLTTNDRMYQGFRYGALGVFGEFEDTLPPTVDFLSVSADTAEYVFLDLIQIRAGAGS